ncbi:YopX family protein [Brevibacillus laterosporus]|uniref:YopX family protein n=1 Tax=Brevibacillus laterosporus TaxID=1465 RepID=UPI0020CEA0E5|nr:YopX family protein [Brevibacillus laterosporus]
MREIKFQCICRATREKFVPDKIDFKNGIVHGSFGGMWNNYCHFSLTPNGNGDAWLRQYTGLHDNTKWDDLTEQEQQEWLQKGKTQEEWKGKEIYKGDIVQISDHPFHGSIIINGNYKVGYNEQMELCCGSWLLFREKHYAEIIGNIYEHPHLLNTERFV